MQLNQTATVNITLTVGSVSSSVDVMASNVIEHYSRKLRCALGDSKTRAHEFNL